MASALDMPLPHSVVDGVFHSLPNELRSRQQCIAEITEMIHVGGQKQHLVFALPFMTFILVTFYHWCAILSS